MTAREHILAAIRAAAVPPAPGAAVPAASLHGSPETLCTHFAQVLTDVGGEAIVRADAQPIDALLNDLRGSERENAMFIRGRFAVAENGAVYIDAADLQARNDAVRCEHLVVIVPFDAIVPTMHEAVRLIPADSTCGWFLSGPSKTADIEQSLVIGAQGSRTHRVILDRG